MAKITEAEWRHTERQAVPGHAEVGLLGLHLGLTLCTTDVPEVYHVAPDEVTGMETPSLGTVWPSLLVNEHSFITLPTLYPHAYRGGHKLKWKRCLGLMIKK